MNSKWYRAPMAKTRRQAWAGGGDAQPVSMPGSGWRLVNAYVRTEEEHAVPGDIILSFRSTTDPRGTDRGLRSTSAADRQSARCLRLFALFDEVQVVGTRQASDLRRGVPELTFRRHTILWWSSCVLRLCLDGRCVTGIGTAPNCCPGAAQSQQRIPNRCLVDVN